MWTPKHGRMTPRTWHSLLLGVYGAFPVAVPFVLFIMMGFALVAFTQLRAPETGDGWVIPGTDVTLIAVLLEYAPVIGDVDPRWLIAAAVALGSVAAGIVLFCVKDVFTSIRIRQTAPLQQATVKGWHNIFPVRRRGLFDIAKNKHRKEILFWAEKDGRYGQSLPYRPGVLRQWAVGDEIDIFRGPRRSVWEGDVGPRATRKRDMPVVRRGNN